MVTEGGANWYARATGAFEPVSAMLDNGQCEPLKAAVHGVLFATVCLCAAYNTAAWLKRRQPHLAINAIIYIGAACWERSHIVHHLQPCRERDDTGAAESLSEAA